MTGVRNTSSYSYENMVETVQQYWPKGRSCASKEWMWGRYSNTLIGWHYELKKKNHLEMWCILVYKTILIKKNITYSFTHNLAFALTNMPHYDYFNGPASFSVECESTWGPTGKNNKKTSGGAVRTSPVPSTPANLSLQKCLLYMSRSQTCKLQR